MLVWNYLIVSSCTEVDVLLERHFMKYIDLLVECEYPSKKKIKLLSLFECQGGQVALYTTNYPYKTRSSSMEKSG